MIFGKDQMKALLWGMIEDLELPKTLVPTERLPKPEPIIGVYFLFLGGDLRYIGSSINLLGRVLTHSIEGIKDFDSYAFIETEWDLHLSLESILIRTLEPEYNLRNCTSLRINKSKPKLTDIKPGLLLVF